MDDSILNNLEAQMSDVATPAEKPGQVLETAAVVEESPPDIRRGGSAMDEALSHLSPAIALRIATVAARYGIRENNDPFWGTVEVMENSFECAKASGAAASAAGASAVEVQSAISAIPDTVYQGAVRAGEEVRGVIAHEIRGKAVEAGMALKMLIDSSAKAGASALKTAGDDLETRLGLLPADVEKLVDQKTREGVQVFADAAAMAGAKMAKAAAASRFLWSVSGVAVLLIVFSVIGAFIDHEYLSLTHRITPKPLVMSASGKPNCGLITMGGQRQNVCQLR